MADQPVSLHQVERFADLTDAELAALASAGTYVTVPEGWALLGGSGPADAAYLLVTGEVTVRGRGAAARTLGPGQLFGNANVVGAPLRGATVVARTRLECLQLAGADVEGLLGQVPAFDEALAEAAEGR